VAGYDCNPSSAGGIGGSQSEASAREEASKITKVKRAGGMAPVEECLPSKHQALILKISLSLKNKIITISRLSDTH
jgi:hypothetical protein